MIVRYKRSNDMNREKILLLILVLIILTSGCTEYMANRGDTNQQYPAPDQQGNTPNQQQWRGTPVWFGLGAIFTYDGISSYKDQYLTSRGVIAVITVRITGGNGQTYFGDTTVQNVYYPELVQTYQWSYTNGEPTLGGDFVVWVDPANPRQAYGLPWVVVGQGPYSAAGQTWDATQLIFRVPGTPGEQHLIYDTQTGIVLYRDENNPAFMQQYTLRSISTN